MLMTLTTDWGIRDYHVGTFKGLLMKSIPEIQIVDISHQVARHNIQQAAYIFNNAWPAFPAGTLHFIGVHNQTSTNTELIAIKKDGHIFLGLNDGFFSLIFQEPPIDMVTIPVSEGHSLFHLPDLVRASTQLLSGKNLYELGQRPDEYVQRAAFLPAIDEELIHGVVIYIDEFGNIITNIRQELFEARRKGRKFSIVARKSQHSIDQISIDYAAVEGGNALALFNDAGYLEIAINEDSAYKLMNLRLNDNIRIEFK